MGSTMHASCFLSLSTLRLRTQSRGDEGVAILIRKTRTTMALRRSVVSACAFALAGCVLSVAAPDQINRTETLINRLANPELGVMVVAHRACWSDAPENSLAG
jgi:hypothetical protein